MAILYALVARGTTVLAEFGAVSGNTVAVARRILEKLPAEVESRLCFKIDTSSIFSDLILSRFSVWPTIPSEDSKSVEKPLLVGASRRRYLVFDSCHISFTVKPTSPFITQIVLGRIPFSYLEDIQMRFIKSYGKVAPYAPAYAMNDEFSRVLHQQMEFFSSNPSADTLNRVRSEVGEVRTIMVDNIEKILDRGDRIELLVDKTSTMQDSAFHFKKQSKRLRRALWMKNAKLLALLTCLIFLLLYIIVAACCGGITLPSCRS